MSNVLLIAYQNTNQIHEMVTFFGCCLYCECVPRCDDLTCHLTQLPSDKLEYACVQDLHSNRHIFQLIVI